MFDLKVILRHDKRLQTLQEALFKLNRAEAYVIRDFDPCERCNQELVDIVLSYFIKAEEESELSHLLFLEYLQIIKNVEKEDLQDSIPHLMYVLRNPSDIRLALEWVQKGYGPSFKLSGEVKRQIIKIAAQRLTAAEDRETLHTIAGKVLDPKDFQSQLT